jgi:type IV pilus assembly protein PilE
MLRLHRAHGLTLLELAVALAITAALASVAYPLWREQLIKARRLDAHSALANLQLAQERHRSAQGRYADHTAQLAHPSLSPAAHYVLTVEQADRTGYTLVAAARSGSPQEGDRACARIALMVQAGASVEMAAAEGQALEPDISRRCWAP